MSASHQSRASRAHGSPGLATRRLSANSLFLRTTQKIVSWCLPPSGSLYPATKKRTPTLRVYEEIKLRFSSVLYCQPIRVDQASCVNRYGFLWRPKSYAHHSTTASKKMNFTPLPTVHGIHPKPTPHKARRVSGHLYMRLVHLKSSVLTMRSFETKDMCRR